MHAEMIDTAVKLTSPGKGVLASDESTSTIGKRLARFGIDNTEESRRAYRELFYTADGIGNSLAGAVLYKETLFQNTSDGIPFVDCLKKQGILPGVKVDEGLTPLLQSPSESHTKGLEGLADNCVAYYSQGARFSKWRAALKIGKGLPSEAAVQTCAEELAQYAAVSQAKGLVPLVEPEILIDGDHSIQQSQGVAERVLQACVAQLWQKSVHLEASLLKIQMVLPGSESGSKASSDQIAYHTLQAITRSVPPAVPGILFLSGGQSEEEATINLNTINEVASRSQKHYALSFSYGRALQASVLQLWSQDRNSEEQIQKAKAMASSLAAANAAASIGKFSGRHPSITSNSSSLIESFRGWTGT